MVAKHSAPMLGTQNKQNTTTAERQTCVQQTRTITPEHLCGLTSVMLNINQYAYVTVLNEHWHNDLCSTHYTHATENVV